MTITIFLGALLGAMALGVPIAFSLLACGAALMWHMNMFDPQILAQNTIEGANSFPLLAVPFFMLAGEIMNVGGLSRRIVNFAMTLVGHVRGGLKFGVCTPTEAAVVAAVYALFVSTVVYKELKISQLYGLFEAAARTTAIIMFLVAAAMVSAWMITVANLPDEVVKLLQPLLGSPTLLMIAIMALTRVVGTAMEMTRTILIF